MALQSDGPISIGNIATEFGDTAPNSMSEFYAAAGGIPSSGAISLSDFYGASSYIYPYQIYQSWQTRYDNGDGPMPAGGFSANFTDPEPIAINNFSKNSSETIFIVGSLSANSSLAGGELTSINVQNPSPVDTFDVTITPNTNPYDIGQFDVSNGYLGKPFANFVGSVNQYNSLNPNGFVADSFGMQFTYYTTFPNPILSVDLKYVSWSDLYNVITSSAEGPWPSDVPNPTIVGEFDRQYATNSYQAVLSRTGIMQQGTLVIVSVISQTNDTTQTLPENITFEISEGFEQVLNSSSGITPVTYPPSTIEQRTYSGYFIATKDISNPSIICRPGGSTSADRKKIDALAVEYVF
jgi:hypothetical protein